MTYKLWAPTCAVPECNNKVGYHKKQGTIFKWKMFCEPHRDPAQLKAEADRWKMLQGCSNTDAHHGFKCTSHISDASQLDVNHIDGDRLNQVDTNLEILCKVCHQRVTMDNGHHTTRYSNQVYLNPQLFEI
jgi:5-methylcytosine-specific restriction endonuclease McrA